MKRWNSPDFVSLDITETAGNNHQNGNTHGKPCVYDPTLECNAQGNGKGICNNCIYNPGSSSNTGSGNSGDGDTDIMS